MHHLSELIRHLAHSAQAFAEHLGGPGLLGIALVDSSFITLPEAVDLLVVVFTLKQPDWWWYFGAMSTIGSTAGSYVLYALARSGGRAMVRRGFHERHVDRVLEWCRRHGSLVLIIPALLPPPMPFKLFVLVTGVAGIGPWAFTGALLVGRGLRYGGLAWLARHYGESVIQGIQRDAIRFLWPVLALTLVAAAGWWLWRRADVK